SDNHAWHSASGFSHESPVTNHQSRLSNKPPFLPQFCSTRANLYVIHTMALRPTVIGCGVIGVDLPAFLLSKNLDSESIGTPAIVSGPSGGSYPTALRDLAFQHCLSFSLRFCFVF